MYLYSLYDYETNIILVHKKKFTQKEFEKMCEEVPMTINFCVTYIDCFDIMLYLKDKYGFKEINYEATFRLD